MAFNRERTYLPDKSPHFELIKFLREKRPVALATIIEAEGSTPQVPGASALFSEKGLVCGTIGGGFVEAKTQEKALRALQKGLSALLSFNLGDVPIEEADGICGGRLKVLIDAQPDRNIHIFERMRLAATQRRPGVLAARIDKDRGSRIKNIVRYWISKNFATDRLRSSPISGFKDVLQRAFEERKPVLIKRKAGWLYCEPHIPPPQLLVVGAGHVGRAVAHLGKVLDFEVIVTDDRPEFANSARFPEADKIIVANMSRTLKKFSISPDTYIVIVTRGHRHDQEALRACIKSRAAYVGMIGSARKIRLIKAEFLRRGWATAAEWDRVHAPIGLAIGSKTVEEIAVSIAAELIQIRREKQVTG